MSANPDAFKIQIEMGEVIRLHNQTLERLRAFQTERPYAVAPNIMKMVEENLKENVAILYKQWNEVHKPPTERVRHVCKQCNFVFASALPGGICDECRSKGTTAQPAAYGVWPVTPESEAVTQSDATPLPADVVLEDAEETADAALASSDVIEDEIAGAATSETTAPPDEAPESSDVLEMTEADDAGEGEGAAEPELESSVDEASTPGAGEEASSDK